MRLTPDPRPTCERRRFPRWDLPPGLVSLVLKRRHEAHFTLTAPVRNISWGGVRFDLDQPMDAGEHVEVRVTLPGRPDDLLRAAGRVVLLQGGTASGSRSITVAFTVMHDPEDPDRFTERMAEAFPPPGPRAA